MPIATDIDPLAEILNAENVKAAYALAFRSREVSLLGRREVLSGRAKFGIFGDGKETAQIALAHAFQNGDWRSGYYRDQTWMFALGQTTLQQFFAQLYANVDVEAEPNSGGRLMNAHFASRSLDENGAWKTQTEMVNVAADLSPTAAQMPRLVGLAYASRLYRELEELQELTKFSRNGNEIAFGTIGNASCAEGLFWESVNAIGVLKAPAVISIWDDEYGISVHNKDQIVKENLSELLSGFQRTEDSETGYDIYTVPGWNYPALVETYQKAARIAREEHVPAIIHVTELTQPQGHSTSGSHERYKSAERLAWEAEHDCLKWLRTYILDEGLATEEELVAIEEVETTTARDAMKAAWKAKNAPIIAEAQEAGKLIAKLARNSEKSADLQTLSKQIAKERIPSRASIYQAIHKALRLTVNERISARQELVAWRKQHRIDVNRRYSAELISELPSSPLKIDEVKPIYSDDPERIPGFQILNNNFNALFANDARVIAFGEDVGFLGGVNQSMAGMQQKYGELRVSDTGIREATILGQAIGLALRGLRPIAEIQYLDYILYALQPMSDDLATLRWRTSGGQAAPVIIRTRGHRLEGVWHAGSPMAGVLNWVRGMHVLVPRDMTRAVGFYNTLLKGDDPALVVEPLNGYRLKEPLPDNLTDITIPLGVPEVLREGDDVTVVTYAAMCNIVLKAAERLARLGIEVELIDVQSLLPFDVNHRIVESLKKTNRVLFIDEDVPGGATAFMMREVLEVQGGYWHLDSEPITISSYPHRPAYGKDGAYFSKPNAEDVFDAVYEMMSEAEPAAFPTLY